MKDKVIFGALFVLFGFGKLAKFAGYVCMAMLVFVLPGKIMESFGMLLDGLNWLGWTDRNSASLNNPSTLVFGIDGIVWFLAGFVLLIIGNWIEDYFRELES